MVEAPEIEVNAKRLIIESVVDTTQSSSWAGSINSEGSLFASESKSSTAWVNTVSGFKATDNMSIVVDETMELIGAVVDGPDGKTYIESGSFCYSDIQEHSNSKSTSVNAGFIWDMRNMQFGSGIPVTIDTDYHHKVEEGTTHATIAGDDSIDGINHNRNTIQTRNVVKDKHVRVFVPVIDPVVFKEELGGVWDTFIEHFSNADEATELSKLNEIQDKAERGEAPVLEASDSLFGYELVREESDMPSSATLETLVSRNDELGGRLSITVIHEGEPTTDANWEAIGVVEGEDAIRIVAKDGSGQEILIEAEGNARMEWLGAETSVGMREEDLRAYVQSLFDYQQGFGRGFWIDGPRNVVKETVGLVKGAAQLAWDALQDPQKAELKTFMWVLDRYLNAKIEWAEFRADKQAYLTQVYESRKASIESYIEELAGDPEAGGSTTFALAAAFTPIPIGKGAGFGKGVLKAERLGDDIKDIANALPKNLEFARVIKPDQVRKLKAQDIVSLSDYPGAIETFITTSEALPRGLSKKELAKMLTIPEKNVGAILRFKLEGDNLKGLATPHNHDEMKGFVNGGKTKGGLPEYVIPNREMNSMHYELELLE